jgi:hypothetical protein
MRRNIVVFSRTFRSMFGPLTRGSVNLLVSLFRLLRIVFGGSVDDGRNLADSMTNVVDRFNRWLLVLDGSGRTRIKRFFDGFNSTLRLLFHDPQEFARRAAVFFIQVARAGFWKFVQTWWSLDLSSKLFVLAFLFRGAIFATMGKLAAGLFMSTFLPRMTAAFAAEGLVGSAFARFGAISGAAWGRAFLAGALTFGLYALYKHLQKHPFNPGGIFSGLHTSNKPSGLTVNNAAKLGPKMPESRTHWLRDHPKRAGGGNIPWGTSAIVGEAGPELMAAGASGPRITPMGFAPPGASGLRSMESILSVSDMLPPVQINLIADGRKLATVVHNFNESTRSRRGGRPLGAT